LIAAKPFEFWFKLFHLCHEFRFDGGESPAKQKNKVIKTGYYSRIALPAAGTVLDQPNLIMDVFTVMSDQYANAQFRKVK
jgi:hypothetical protein